MLAGARAPLLKASFFAALRASSHALMPSATCTLGFSPRRRSPESSVAFKDSSPSKTPQWCCCAQSRSPTGGSPDSRVWAACSRRQRCGACPTLIASRTSARWSSAGGWALAQVRPSPQAAAVADSAAAAARTAPRHCVGSYLACTRAGSPRRCSRRHTSTPFVMPRRSWPRSSRRRRCACCSAAARRPLPASARRASTCRVGRPTRPSCWHTCSWWRASRPRSTSSTRTSSLSSACATASRAIRGRWWRSRWASPTTSRSRRSPTRSATRRLGRPPPSTSSTGRGCRLSVLSTARHRSDQWLSTGCTEIHTR